MGVVINKKCSYIKGLSMHEKNIKIIVGRQLKKKLPDWHNLTKKEKKALAIQVSAEVVKGYDFRQKITTPLPELIGIPDIVKAKIMTLPQMELFVYGQQARIIKFPVPARKHLADPELSAIDKLLDDSILDLLLAPPGYTQAKRLIFPANFFRAELLKSLKFPEISYRKFCPTQLNSLEQKTNRAFVGLPLKRKLSIDHSQLSQFRLELTFSQLVNLMVYFIYLFIKSGRLDRKCVLWGADSTELPAPCDPHPLATIKVKGQKVRIYTDLDADCGVRRNKRDKSKYFVGYRMHSLTAIDPLTQQSYPILSLIAPGNHHDNLFLPQLVQLGRAIGLDIQVITTDEGYADAEQNQQIQQQCGITVLSTPSEKVLLPEAVDPQTKGVYLDKLCDIPMVYLGKTEEGNHEFKCSAEPGDCPRYALCLKGREIPQDAGHFGVIPQQISGVSEALNLRKHAERPFNLLKHREGLEPVRVRSQHGLMVVATIAGIANLLLEIVATRKTKPKEESLQLKLDLVA